MLKSRDWDDLLNQVVYFNCVGERGRALGIAVKQCDGEKRREIVQYQERSIEGRHVANE